MHGRDHIRRLTRKHLNVSRDTRDRQCILCAIQPRTQLYHSSIHRAMAITRSLNHRLCSIISGCAEINRSPNGGQDTLLAKARVNVAAFFRPRGETPQLGGAKKFNGKFDKNAKQACVAYNNDKEHNASSLSADGSCRFNHVCNQFVSDKGPAGMCWAAHPRCKCNYDTTKRLNSPQK